VKPRIVRPFREEALQPAPGCLVRLAGGGAIPLDRVNQRAVIIQVTPVVVVAECDVLVG
jgi:hypothetical protein